MYRDESKARAQNCPRFWFATRTWMILKEPDDDESTVATKHWWTQYQTRWAGRSEQACGGSEERFVLEHMRCSRSPLLAESSHCRLRQQQNWARFISHLADQIKNTSEKYQRLPIKGALKFTYTVKGKTLKWHFHIQPVKLSTRSQAGDSTQRKRRFSHWRWVWLRSGVQFRGAPERDSDIFAWSRGVNSQVWFRLKSLLLWKSTDSFQPGRDLSRGCQNAAAVTGWLSEHQQVAFKKKRVLLFDRCGYKEESLTADGSRSAPSSEEHHVPTDQLL